MCDVPPCDATLAASCSVGLLVTRVWCSRLPSLRSRWWTLRCPEPRDGERTGPVPSSGRSWFIRPDANGSGVGWVSPSPQELPTRVPVFRCAVGPGVQSPVPVSRPESGCETHGGRTIPSAGGRAGGCRRRGACCNRDKSAVSGCPRSNQTEKGLSFLWKEGEQDAPLSGQQSCLLVSACSERVGGIVWAWIKGRKI